MNFLEINLRMIDEAMKLREDLKVGKVSFDNYMAHMGGMATVGKMFDRHLRFLNTEKKLKISLRDVGPDLVGYNPETEIIECPGAQKQIERDHCLDWSGEAKFLECDGCEVGKQTKKLLLGEE